MTFQEEFTRFLTDEHIAVSASDDGLSYTFPEFDINITLIPLPQDSSFKTTFHGTRRASGTIYLFEDRWRNKESAEAIRKRIAAHLGHFRSIFARKCEIRRIDAAVARTFLDKNHSYGYAKARYKYGMFYQGELVAVSLFSAPRAMTADRGGILSYEWIRYSSLADCRVSGGMGKMLAYFIREMRPQEVMSYADLEWSSGEAYASLGFKQAGFRPPVDFWIDPVSYERRREPPGLKIRNIGSIKYLLTIS